MPDPRGRELFGQFRHAPARHPVNPQHDLLPLGQGPRRMSAQIEHARTGYVRVREYEVAGRASAFIARRQQRHFHHWLGDAGQSA
jgi:hypothetical protein